MNSKFSQQATLIVQGSLGDFLDQQPAEDPIPVDFFLHPSVKDLFEAQGIPHTAVRKIEINGLQRAPSHNISSGDRIILYPYCANTSKVEDSFIIRPNAFIADVHLGKLTNTLRLLGLDTAYNDDWDDEEIIRRSNAGPRMILTRDRELLKRSVARYGYWVRSVNPDEQIQELFARFALSDLVQPFTRCMKCNGKLQPVSLEQVKQQVPPKVQQWHSEYWQCTACGQIYWQGSHYEDLQQKVDKLLQP